MKLLNSLSGGALAFAVAAAPALADYPERNIENIYPWNPGATDGREPGDRGRDGRGAGRERLGRLHARRGRSGRPSRRRCRGTPTGTRSSTATWPHWSCSRCRGTLIGATRTSPRLWSATANAFAIAVRKGDERFPDLAALIEAMREAPGELRYSPGTANALPHMSAAKMMQVADVHAQIVPYPRDRRRRARRALGRARLSW